MSHRPFLPFSNFCVQLRFFLFLIHFLSQKPEHCLIVFRDVRETASGAVLEYPTLLIFTEDRIARTVRIRIHRTIAEQAVKVSALHARMAGEIFAVSVLKKTLAVFHSFIIPFLITLHRPRRLRFLSFTSPNILRFAHRLLPQQQDLLFGQAQVLWHPSFFDLLMAALLYIPAYIR